MGEKEYPDFYPGWETIRKLGSGSFGSVYEIQRDLFGKIEKAALKVITIPQNEGDIEELYSNGYDEESVTAHFKSHLADIVREYSLMAEMKGHTNVVYCDDIRYIQHDDGIGWDIFIKMELLTPLLKTLGKTVSEAEVLRLGRDLCQALVLCKGKNIVHRDIKPQNIFVSESGDYKLGDFGIAKTVERTSGGTKIGTYSYMAPEVYNNQPYGSAADIYSLGLVLYWLLNERRLPFLPLPPAMPTSSDNETARLRRFQGEAMPAPKNGSAELKRIVLKACAFEAKDRYESAAEMLADLEVLQKSAPATVFVSTPAPQKAAEPEPEDGTGTMGVWSKTEKEEDASGTGTGTIGVWGKPDKPEPEDSPTESGTISAWSKKLASEPEIPEAETSTPKKKTHKRLPWLVGGGVALAALIILLIALPEKKAAFAAPTPNPTAAPTPSPTASTTATPNPTAAPTPSPIDAPTPSPTDAPTPSPTDAPTPSPTATPEKTPSEQDLLDIGTTIIYPDASSYLSAYETKYVKSHKGYGGVYLYCGAKRTENYRRGGIDEETEVTVIARENDCSCVIFLLSSGKQKAGWVASEYLVDEY